MEIVDGQRLAGELDARLKDAVAALTRTAGAPFRVVEVAYTDGGFGELYEGVFAESAAYAQSIGVSYDVTKVTSRSSLQAVLTSLSVDNAVQGIRVRGYNLHRGDDWFDPYGVTDPAKDIDCRSVQNMYDLLRGFPAVVHPELGAIFRILGHALPAGIKGKTVALIGSGAAAMDMQSELPFAAAVHRAGADVLCCHDGSGRSEAVRRADIVVSCVGRPGYLDASYVRDGQIIIDLGIQAPDANLAQLHGMAATYADWGCVWLLASRQVYVNLARARLLESPPAQSPDLRWLY